jgi:glycosyltransferase involved in cell wall biosynthesis
VNEERTIGDAIEPLLAESAPGGLEVIVAVAPSTDRTLAVVEAIARRDPRVRVVLNPAGVTPAGLNAAITASRGDVILRMDGHAIPQPGYVAACLAALTSSGAWNVGGEQRKTGRTPAARAAAAANTSAFGIGGGRHHLATDAVDVDTVWLGCWPRWVLEEVGLFDPEMVRNQDDEHNQRIRDAGGRIRFDPSIAAIYVSRASWRGLIKQHFGYGLYKVRGIQKRPRLLRPRHLAPAAFVGAVVGAGALSLVRPRVAAPGLGALLALWFGSAVLAARRVADDPRALYEGGIGPPFPGTDVRSPHRHVEASLQAWIRRNGCTVERALDTRTGAPGTINQGQTATLLVWDRSSSGRPVQHWKLTGVGHAWPGNERGGLMEEIIGPSTTLILAAEEAWRFFAPISR